MDFYWYCAIAGSGLFFLQFLLTVLGSGSEEMSDAAGGVEAGKFRWFTRQGITGFILFFGWCGVTCYKQFALEPFAVFCFSVLAGAVALCSVALLFLGAQRLVSSGARFCLDDAIGKEAVVYQEILAGGEGKITLSLHGIAYEITAISKDSERIASFTMVKVVEKVNETTVSVRTCKGP